MCIRDRGTRIVVLPLWAHHLGLSDAATSLVVAVSWGIDTLLFYPGGWIMDRYGCLLYTSRCV